MIDVFPECLNNLYFMECITPIVRKLSMNTRFTDEQLVGMMGEFFSEICRIGEQDEAIVMESRESMRRIVSEVTRES